MSMLWQHLIICSCIHTFHRNTVSRLSHSLGVRRIEGLPPPDYFSKKYWTRFRNGPVSLLDSLVDYYYQKWMILWKSPATCRDKQKGLVEWRFHYCPHRTRQFKIIHPCHYQRIDCVLAVPVSVDEFTNKRDWCWSNLDNFFFCIDVRVTNPTIDLQDLDIV
jgi:hypothetical protein